MREGGKVSSLLKPDQLPRTMFVATNNGVKEITSIRFLNSCDSDMDMALLKPLEAAYAAL